MSRIFVQYLAFNNNENLPKGIKMAKLGSKCLNNPKIAKYHKTYPNCWNFTKSGHNDHNENLFCLSSAEQRLDVQNSTNFISASSSS